MVLIWLKISNTKSVATKYELHSYFNVDLKTDLLFLNKNSQFEDVNDYVNSYHS